MFLPRPSGAGVPLRDIRQLPPEHHGGDSRHPDGGVLRSLRRGGRSHGGRTGGIGGGSPSAQR